MIDPEALKKYEKIKGCQAQISEAMIKQDNKKGRELIKKFCEYVKSKKFKKFIAGIKDKEEANYIKEQLHDACKSYEKLLLMDEAHAQAKGLLERR